MHPTNVLRQLKHAAFVQRKRARRAYRHGKFAVATAVLGPLGERLPYRFRPGRYAEGRHSLRWLDVAAEPGGAQALPRRVFVIWAGDNPLTPARERNLARIREIIGEDVILVTQKNLGDWLVADHPLHPAYENLSLIHRSDYLRGYLMHHHGGGYVDLKEPLHSWTDSFAAMKADPGRWVTSYPTTDANWIGKLRGRAGWDILVRHRLMFGKSGFIMRSHTPLTAEWMAEMDRRLDAVRDLLARHPGGVFGDDADYPVSWTDLLGRVLDPLTLKYLGHVAYDRRMLLRFEDYR